MPFVATLYINFFCRNDLLITKQTLNMYAPCSVDKGKVTINFQGLWAYAHYLINILHENIMIIISWMRKHDIVSNYKHYSDRMSWVALDINKLCSSPLKMQKKSRHVGVATFWIRDNIPTLSSPNSGWLSLAEKVGVCLKPQNCSVSEVCITNNC